MTGVPDEIPQHIATAFLHAAQPWMFPEDEVPPQSSVELAQRGLAAVWPLIESHVREQVAGEIRQEGRDDIGFLDGDTSVEGIARRVGAEDAYKACYRVARGAVEAVTEP